ncbi:DUF402 domain-containing protein [Kitasatospora viridis]|uniref:DUF402 domain-containing protein n=1 Tax=Kitasatospora viridis TaxID=281105 RepID=UPI0014796ABA|nr:DUF402 domain-containing protein [Kitasatospora viridis]
MSNDLFAAGDTAIRRDVHMGRVWTAMPQRVLDDTGAVLTLAYWPGIVGLAPITWIAAHRTGDNAMRARGLTDLAGGRWQLAPYYWEHTELLSYFLTGEHFSVHCFQSAGTHQPLRWYVNFELPFVRRRGLGIDTLDLCLDLLATPDLGSWWWKDEQEYAQVRRLGMVDDALDRQVATARSRALALLEDRAGPFARGWPRWSPDPDWPLPELPADTRW